MTWKPGLDGVVAARTALSHIDGEQGRLLLCGYPVDQLAPAATFEETVHLLWQRELPSQAQHLRLRQELARHRRLPARTRSLLEGAVADGLSPIEALRLGLEAADLGTAIDEAPLVLLGLGPIIVAAHWRLGQGLQPVEPATDAGYAAAFLHMLRGGPSSAAETRALETYLNTMVDHGLNASTFTARVITSTRSDLRSAVVGALGALKGPLHGGAPEPVLEMLQAIDSPADVEPHLRAILDRGERIMGFGHREYRVRDPRAQVLADALEGLAGRGGPQSLVDIARLVEEKATQLLDEAKPGRQLRTNAEFYTAVLLHRLGIAPGLFTAAFALSRMAGWIAHCLEQQRVDRIYRPTSVYEGPPPREWVALEAR